MSEAIEPWLLIWEMVAADFLRLQLSDAWMFCAAAGVALGALGPVLVWGWNWLRRQMPTRQIKSNMRSDKRAVVTSSSATNTLADATHADGRKARRKTVDAQYEPFLSEALHLDFDRRTHRIAVQTLAAQFEVQPSNLKRWRKEAKRVRRVHAVPAQARSVDVVADAQVAPIASVETPSSSLADSAAQATKPQSLQERLDAIVVVPLEASPQHAAARCVDWGRRTFASSRPLNVNAFESLAKRNATMCASVHAMMSRNSPQGALALVPELLVMSDDVATNLNDTIDANIDSGPIDGTVLTLSELIDQTFGKVRAPAPDVDVTLAQVKAAATSRSVPRVVTTAPANGSDRMSVDIENWRRHSGDDWSALDRLHWNNNDAHSTAAGAVTGPMLVSAPLYQKFLDAMALNADTRGDAWGTNLRVSAL